ncbi:response regulator transcription factor [Acidipila sp. EB88]|uniref:response regulator transcription factor n=1 Tax=Acidipila sp. EB88 TaxID=2305226 RepID=UPI000F5E0FF1|nr:response regulator [Acidipila sp. EB88]RRA49287.1 DNA-binding response regulator [Acidipila sp. EB88]
MDTKVDQPGEVVIVDSDVSTRESLMDTLHAEGFLVRGFGSAEEFLKFADEKRVICVILEAYLPGLDGLQLQQLIKAKWPAVSVMFVAEVANIPMSVRAMKGGAIEFLTKPCQKDCVVSALHSAAERCKRTRLIEAELYLLRDRYARLTPRERVIFPLVAAGVANWKVGLQLGISEMTVKVHRGNVMRKMNAESLAALILMGFKLQLPIRTRSVPQAAQSSTPSPSSNRSCAASV